MEVAYGETLHLFSSFLSGVHEGADCDYPSQPAFIGLPSLKEDDNTGINQSPSYVSSSPLSEPLASESLDLDALLAAEPAQYRTDLLRVLSYLQRLVPDKVVVHNDSVGERVLRRLEDGLEPKAFVAFDVHHVVRQWATFRALFEDVTVSVRAGATNRSMLAALVQALGVSTSFESLADIAALRDSVHDAARLEAIHEEAAPASPEEHFCHAFEPAGCMDVALIRSVTRIRAALAAGVRMMCVGSISGIHTISRAARGVAVGRSSKGSSSSSKRTLPNLMLAVRRSASAPAVSTEEVVPGAALNSSDILSFSAEAVPRAVEAAFRAGMSVTGVRGGVDSLLDGSLELALRYVVSNSHHEGSYTVLVDDLDTAVFGLVNSAAGVEQTCMSAAERNATLQSIRSALRSLRAVMHSCSRDSLAPEHFLPEQDTSSAAAASVEVEIVADASLFMLGTCQTLTTRVIGARPCVDEFGESLGRQFYIDDGIYGTLCRRATGVDAVHHAPAFVVGTNAVTPYVMNESKRPFDAAFDGLPCTVWGQTCDSIDKVFVAPGGVLPPAFGLGDWLAFSCVTLQSQGTNTGFNGYDGPAMRYMVHIGF